MYVNGFRCDVCGKFSPRSPSTDPEALPQTWLHLQYYAIVGEVRQINPTSKHFCSHPCLLRFLEGGGVVEFKVIHRQENPPSNGHQNEPTHQVTQ